MEDDENRPVRRDDARARVNRALVACGPTRLSKSKFLNSVSLAQMHQLANRRGDQNGSGAGERRLTRDVDALQKNERESYAKSLTRAIKGEVFCESLAPTGKEFGLTQVGLVAVSVSVPELKAIEFEERGSFKLKIHGDLSEGDFCSSEYLDRDSTKRDLQASLVKEIIFRTGAWSGEFEGAHPPVYIKAIWVVHGSSDYDILINVLYNETEMYMKYVRRVLQSIEGVEGTQTMLATEFYSEPDCFDLEGG